MVERALIQYKGGALSLEALLPPADMVNLKRGQGHGGAGRLPSPADVNTEHIRQALKMSGGKINGPGGAAEILGINTFTLRKRMNKLGIPYGRKSWASPI